MTESSAPELPPVTAESDETDAPGQLFAALYRELHTLAHRALKREGNHLSISTTTLLHEAYINLEHREHAVFTNHGGFLAYAAQAMRGHIVDATRRGLAIKRGSDFAITGLHTDLAEEIPDERYLLRIDEAQQALWAVDPALGELVDLKYFCGLSLTEIAALRGVTERTMQREWQRARLLLLNLMDAEG